MENPVKRKRLPSWFRIEPQFGPSFAKIKSVVANLSLHTVCEEARCPNQSECWNGGTATFMILGEVCTRSCGFCAVATGKPNELDRDEPARVARAVRELGLRHAVITSVNRDELEDGGAGLFAETIERTRRENPECVIEVLIPDFQGEASSLQAIIKAKPDILNHNLETVPRLYTKVRPQAKYIRSMFLLERSKKAGMKTKTGIMVGLGETEKEILEVMADLSNIRCDIMTIGQYLQPTREHIVVERFYDPSEFADLKKKGEALGIPLVVAGPLVRSSYHADRLV